MKEQEMREQDQRHNLPGDIRRDVVSIVLVVDILPGATPADDDSRLVTPAVSVMVVVFTAGEVVCCNGSAVVASDTGG